MPHAPFAGPSLRLRLFGIPVLFHWSFPGVGLGIAIPAGVVTCFAASNLAFELFGWCLAAVSALALVHEVGHAVAARLLSLEVHALVFAAGGACCIADEAASAGHEVAYSAAGVVSQTAVLVTTSLMLLGAWPSPEVGCGVAVFTAVNLLLILANCWPSGGSDGQRILCAVDRLLAPREQGAALSAGGTAAAGRCARAAMSRCAASRLRPRDLDTRRRITRRQRCAGARRAGSAART